MSILKFPAEIAQRRVAIENLLAFITSHEGVTATVGQSGDIIVMARKVTDSRFGIPVTKFSLIETYADAREALGLNDTTNQQKEISQ